MRIALHDFEVTLKDSLTWGDMQQIQAVVTSGAKFGTAGLQGYDSNALLEAKYKALEIAIITIQPHAARQADDSVAMPDPVPFSREWMNALSVEDGDILYDAVDGLGKKK